MKLQRRVTVAFGLVAVFICLSTILAGCGPSRVKAATHTFPRAITTALKWVASQRVKNVDLQGPSVLRSAPHSVSEWASFNNEENQYQVGLTSTKTKDPFNSSGARNGTPYLEWVVQSPALPIQGLEADTVIWTRPQGGPSAGITLGDGVSAERYSQACDLGASGSCTKLEGPVTVILWSEKGWTWDVGGTSKTETISAAKAVVQALKGKTLPSPKGVATVRVQFPVSAMSVAWTSQGDTIVFSASLPLKRALIVKDTMDMVASWKRMR